MLDTGRSRRPPRKIERERERGEREVVHGVVQETKYTGWSG
jgi:hypothetical protein